MSYRARCERRREVTRRTVDRRRRVARWRRLIDSSFSYVRDGVTFIGFRFPSPEYR